MFEEKLNALSQMMAEHMAAPFPPGFRGLDIEGQDMVLLDADVYGLASVALEGPLDEQRRAGLLRLTVVFERVLPAIDDEYAAKYYTHVRDMAVLAAEIEASRDMQPDQTGEPMRSQHYRSCRQRPSPRR
ncbi:hypothetical protein OHA57_39670 (plasmid) [Streptomyces anulatus]|uniref:hypothetical protein n=1 Tax=Streptomyces anulatus TaxID=1892 RepID=UPI002DD8BE01|nr:hypothetical protein [Streptomyces anulatus]WSC66876.1 hypothetical protein OHA57_39670 [Streptomyces anulatus]WTC68687.1 hypothetical protein OG865_39730 [Streptomyces anulatus]